MTLVIAVKCNDGIVVMSDTLFTNETGYKEDHCKVFPILDDNQATFLLGYSHKIDWIHNTLKVLRDNFEISSQRVTIDETELENILNECINEQNRQINQDLEQQKAKGIPDIPFHGFVAGIISKDKNQNFVLYNYRLNQKPSPYDLLALGEGSTEANLLIDKIIPSLLRQMDLVWKDLPSKLVAQILMFVMRYVSRNNSMVGQKVNGYLISENGWKSYKLEQFFPKHFDANHKLKYQYEIIETFFESISLEKIKKGFDSKFILELFSKFLK